MKKRIKLLFMVALLVFGAGLASFIYAGVDNNDKKQTTSSPKTTENTLEVSQKNIQAYPVELSTMSLVGFNARCNGSIDNRRTVLANLWNNLGNKKVFGKRHPLYKQKIFVVYYDFAQDGSNAYSIFIGYPVISWLTKPITYQGDYLTQLDLPSTNYWGYDVPGTSANSVIKSWDNLYGMYPNLTRSRAMEVYTLDPNTFYPVSVTLYLKK